MKKRIIDMEKDPRREQYAYFAPLRDPYVGVTCRVDATGWQKRRTASGAPVFLSLAYEILAAANSVPELRRRIENGQVVEYDRCRCSCTVAKPDGAYAYCTLDCTLPWDAFLKEGRERLAEARSGGTMGEDGESGEYFFASCVPRLDYTSMVQPVPEPPVSNVRLAWGKCVTENGKTSLPVTIVAHHALVDGIHLAAFFDELRRRLG